MADLIISNELAEQLNAIARQESRPLEAVLATMIEQYKEHHTEPTVLHPVDTSDEAAYQAALREIRPKVYAQARRYWQEVGDGQRLALTDEQLDEQFWLIDSEGIPRLKTEQGTVTIPANSLYNLGQLAERLAFRSGQPDIAERSRDILHQEYGDYLQHRLDRQADDAE